MSVFPQIEVELLEFMGSDRTIAESAWTSSSTKRAKELRTDEDVQRVVRMLADNGHAVPFESVIFRFWFRIPISCDRQIMTHRIASMNGMSGRYRTMPNDYQEIPEHVGDIYERAEMNHQLADYNKIAEMANTRYSFQVHELKKRRDNGTITEKEFKDARQFIRGILPQNNMTERTMTMNLRSLANFIRMRYSVHAQDEIRDLATKILREMQKKCQSVYTALSALEQKEWDITPAYEPPTDEVFFPIAA
jgi:thymidylate synthase (FAD)